MNCRNVDIQELLPSYVSGGLDNGTKERVDGHLATCDDCRRELGLLAMLSEEAVPDPGEAFWRELPGRVEREVRARRSAAGHVDLSRFIDRLLLPRWTWAAAALASLVLISWLVVAPFRSGEYPALHEIYDSGYGSVHDPVLTHPSTNMSDLSDYQVVTIDTWAGQELRTIAAEADSIMPNTDREVYEELAELNGPEIEKLSTMLNDYSEEG